MSGYTTGGTDLNDIFQPRTDGVTTGATATGFKVNGVDLVYKYLGLSGHTYSSNTGFKNSGGSDLNTLFQWGGYSASVSYSSSSVSTNSISFTVSGTYFYVTVGQGVSSITTTANYTSSSFTYTASGLSSGTQYIFSIKAYNGLGISVHPTEYFNLTTTSLIAPTISLNNITGLSASSYTINFSYSGGTYTTCKVQISSDSTNFSTIGTISYASSGTYTTGTLTSYAFYIKLVPYDSNSNAGTSSNQINKYKGNATYTYNTIQTLTALSLPTFTYNVYFIVIGGGGSGGTGGANGIGGQSNGGGGGGGGAGTVTGDTNFNLVGSTTQELCHATVGGGGAGVVGVSASNGNWNSGNDGNDGNDSVMTFEGIYSYSASKGYAGLKGIGADSFAGGAGGSIGGQSGGSDGGAGGAGGTTNHTYGDGSSGSSGQGRDTQSGASVNGTVGLIQVIAYYFQ